MADMTPVHVEPAADIYKELTRRADDGTLASEKEYLTEADAAAEEASESFKVLSPDELTKLKKDELLAYISEKDAHDKKVMERKLRDEAEQVRRAAVHGFKRQPIGEMLPTGRRRGIPTPLSTKEGDARKNKKGGTIYRTDW